MQNLNFGIGMTAAFLSFYFLSLIFISFLGYMKKLIAGNTVRKPKFSLKKIVSSCLRTTDGFSRPSWSISIFVLLFDLYLWLFMLMVMNTTKTNKVVSLGDLRIARCSPGVN